MAPRTTRTPRLLDSLSAHGTQHDAISASRVHEHEPEPQPTRRHRGLSP